MRKRVPDLWSLCKRFLLSAEILLGQRSLIEFRMRSKRFDSKILGRDVRVKNSSLRSSYSLDSLIAERGRGMKRRMLHPNNTNFRQWSSSKWAETPWNWFWLRHSVVFPGNRNNNHARTWKSWGNEPGTMDGNEQTKKLIKYGKLSRISLTGAHRSMFWAHQNEKYGCYPARFAEMSMPNHSKNFEWWWYLRWETTLPMCRLIKGHELV